MTASDTKHTILDAAEILFAEQGFAATSLRQLTARAGVNLAAVNYHFGSKDELAKAVLQRRIEPINAERRRRLDALTRPATVEQIVRAFVEPVLRNEAMLAGEAPAPGETQRPVAAPTSTGNGLCRLFGRINVEQPPFLRRFLAEQFGDLAQRFIRMLGEAAPTSDASTLWWRLHFVIGGMAHTLQNAQLVGQMSDGACDPSDTDTIVEQLVAFSVAGFAKAKPAAKAKPKQRPKQKVIK